MPAKPTRPRVQPKPRGCKPKRSSWRFVLWLAVLALVVPALLLFLPTRQQPKLTPREGLALRDARSWGYQLQNVTQRTIPDALDLLVVDYSRDGSERRVFSRDDVERLRTRTDGSKRIVLAYMSIGEAESYRYYWQSGWAPGSPSWLGPESDEWKGNYAVRYWEPGWWNIIMPPADAADQNRLQRIALSFRPGPRPYLDRIIDAGFDGVYLDRIDAYDHWAAEYKDAMAQMVRFVSAISAYAKGRRAGFLVVPQNGEELLRLPAYRRVIDGIAKEDLVYGVKGDGQPNEAGITKTGIRDLNLLKAEGRPVFVVEYLSEPAQRADALKQLAREGYVVHFAKRDLHQVPE